MNAATGNKLISFALNSHFIHFFSGLIKLTEDIQSICLIPGNELKWNGANKLGKLRQNFGN